MKQEDKQLLFKDICARVPYNVKCRMFKLDSQICTLTSDLLDKVENLEPYLRTISSMTEEEKNELNSISHEFGFEWFDAKTNEERYAVSAKMQERTIDFYNEHHLDYRGLIEKELALEVPEGMYKINKL